MSRYGKHKLQKDTSDKKLKTLAGKRSCGLKPACNECASEIKKKFFEKDPHSICSAVTDGGQGIICNSHSSQATIAKFLKARELIREASK